MLTTILNIRIHNLRHLTRLLIIILMKLLLKVLIFTCFLAFNVMSVNLKSQNSVKIKTKIDYTAQWAQIFTSTAQPPQLCNTPDVLNNTKAQEDPTDDSSSGRTPKPKPNPYATEHGFGQSGYLFDFWDDTFQADITGLFNALWTQAKAIVPADPSVFLEPYALDNLVYIYSQGAAGIQNSTAATPSPDSLTQITKYIQGFNQTTWTNSISVAQVYNILSQWGWSQGTFVSEPARRMVDRYDFDGDGRLNQNEFILFSILNNQNIWTNPSCMNCYSPIFQSKIDPLFAFLDCDQDGLVSSENMWIGLQNLKRNNVNAYNMYTCQMPSALNKGFRTTSPNDFVLKNTKQADGFVNQNEFRSGILLGYWNRQVSTSQIFTDDTMNLKSSRWGSAGSVDTVCQNILAMIPKANPNATPAGNTPVQPSAGSRRRKR